MFQQHFMYWYLIIIYKMFYFYLLGIFCVILHFKLISIAAREKNHEFIERVCYHLQCK